MDNDKERIPPHKRQTPASNPNLVQKWTAMYNDLVNNQGYKKSAALEQIGIEHGGLSRQTIMYWIFPDYKKYQKNSHVRKWSYERERPEIRDRITKYKRKYMDIRLHISDFVQNAYFCRNLTEGMTLEQISESIRSITNISLAPKTIDGLISTYKSKHGRSLLIPVSTDTGQETLYKLNPDL